MTKKYSVLCTLKTCWYPRPDWGMFPSEGWRQQPQSHFFHNICSYRLGVGWLVTQAVSKTSPVITELRVQYTTPWFQNTTMLGHIFLSYYSGPLYKCPLIGILETEKHNIKNEFYFESNNLLPLSNTFLPLGAPYVGTTFPLHFNPSKNDTELCKK